MAEDMRDINLLLLRVLRQSPTGRAEPPKKIESWLDEVQCSGCYEHVEKGDEVYHGNYCRYCVEKADMMEKRGVCSGEGEAQLPAKEAEAKECCGKTCGTTQSQPVKKACGDDLMSKMADEVCPLDRK